MGGGGSVSNFFNFTRFDNARIISQTKYTNGSWFSISLHIIRVCYMFRPYVGHYHS